MVREQYALLTKRCVCSIYPVNKRCASSIASENAGKADQNGNKAALFFIDTPFQKFQKKGVIKFALLIIPYHENAGKDLHSKISVQRYGAGHKGVSREVKIIPNSPIPQLVCRIVHRNL
ncbi:hypothetical protein POVCU2_0016150 [Plasmodium ovale curtisi]|uniref:Uncharacterized protein n=1 Tax=Plasmodium ovale curtisi TaxID=864141 RepID=A0A1A8VQ00_PLAOA|nr:hypothetical protein POVCU2_0016150 [Plasmodium ovale curtisi]